VGIKGIMERGRDYIIRRGVREMGVERENGEERKNCVFVFWLGADN
jgi:hypothetical protein